MGVGLPLSLRSITLLANLLHAHHIGRPYYLFCLLQLDYHHPSSITIHEALVLVLSYCIFHPTLIHPLFVQVCPPQPSCAIKFTSIGAQQPT